MEILKNGNIEKLKDVKIEPKVTDRVFTVGKAGVNNQRGK